MNGVDEMIIFDVTIGLIILVLSIIMIRVCIDDNDSRYISCFLLLLIIMFSVCLGGLIDYAYVCDTIPAIEVYRGNTELQINQGIVNDSIVKCDSVVILKKL